MPAKTTPLEDFESLSSSVAKMEGKAKKGSQPKQSGSFQQFESCKTRAYDRLTYEEVAARVATLESIISGKKNASVTSNEVESQISKFQSAISANLPKKLHTPVKEPFSAVPSDRIYSSLPKPEALSKRIESAKESLVSASKQSSKTEKTAIPFQPPAPLSKPREETDSSPTEIVGDVILARKEMKLAQAEDEIERLKLRLEEIDGAKNAEAEKKAQNISQVQEAERKKESQRMSQELEMRKKELEDEYGRKLMREIARIKAAKNNESEADAHLSGHALLQHTEEYFKINPAKKKGVMQNLQALQQLLHSSGKESAKETQVETEQPEQPDVRPSSHSGEGERQKRSIERMRLEFEEKSREINSLLRKKK
ncbi:hypothetical protein COV61_04360 [Candidatus Micrarchaeota archaeon CG11_big_fil_rev_8_21_14_0_20_47_5]|nr:MAG: hypothetical protein AUJ17_03470 [Candidatus Micrarchaeota archaeon CG1_02_47_40]PIN83012.1 MAG: hypothetical protein COV61_04360 [Candidatus Micrarchaeota archaeon CG11_big_fil_rev_8_21_14_0_20_47_5]